MRITNAEYTPLDILAELIGRTRGIKESDTKEFFSNERASHDWLEMAWSEKIEVILESFRRYGTEVAPTQYIRDHGVDVRLIFDNVSGNTQRIGFQIKSNKEADSNAAKIKNGGESITATLKRQAFEAGQHANLNEWWVISGFDMGKHRKLVSAITVEMTSGKPNPLKIRHVNPREAMAFLAMEDNEIDAICTLLLCKDDEVLKMARREIQELEIGAQNIVLSVLGAALEGERELSFDDIESAALSNTDQKECELEEITNTIEALESIGFLEYDHESHYKVEPSKFVGLCALYFEGRARHEQTPYEASKFLTRMTRNLDR
ncbi:MAG: XopAX family type III secretion system effector [Burkholderiales bacterium]